MADVTARDITIFRVLASGPHTLEQLRLSLRKSTRRDPGDDEAAASQSSKMSPGALRKRLAILMNDDYIQSQRYRERDGTRVFSLYSLTEGSSEILAGVGFNHKHIRVGLPGKKFVSHELMVVDVVKAIKREAAQCAYEFDIEDERYLRGTARGRRKNLPFPDLHVTAYFAINGRKIPREVALEIDNETENPRRVFEKVKKTHGLNKWPSIVLCRTAERVEELSRTFRNGIKSDCSRFKTEEEWNREAARMMRMAFFATIGEFTQRGLCFTRWRTCDGTPGTVVPHGAKTRQ